MKHQLRMAVLLAILFVGLCLAFFSPGASSRDVKSYPHPLAKANASRHLSASRGGARVTPEFDYASALNKPLRWDSKEQPRFSFHHADEQDRLAPEQQSKLAPDVATMVGPFSEDRDLRDLPYIPVTNAEEKEERLMRYPPSEGRMEKLPSDPIVLGISVPQTVTMPSPLQTFAGMTQNLACGGCLPPDTDGDVGPNHYVQAVNSSIRVHDKAGNVLAGPITFNSFFSGMGTSTPCGSNVNNGDPVVFYDHIADRWVISDFAYPAFPGTSFYQCIGVSKTSDPVSGGYWLYAVQVDPANPSFLGDYPKFGLWPDAYYLSVNMFSNNTTFNGVRQFALDRNQMVNGGPANTIAFTITPANLGAEYSLVPASFRTGLPPPAGQPEWFMSINSSAVGGTVENQVFVRRFHADFVTPANSTFGVGAAHSPNGAITVANFVDAFDNTGDTSIVPNGTATATQFLDTLGDKLMYPLIYQNLGGVESVWSSHSVNNNQAGTGPVSVRWYQFNMTGNTIPATPVQQQTFNNGGDGLWRWMPSINVDWQGNMSIGYSASSTTVDPGIRYAGRLASDPLNTLTQGEAVMTPGTGHQTDTSGRWGDYSSVFVDPTDGCTFFHTNEYYSATSAAAWNTSVGSFKFPTCSPSPIPTPTPAATPTPTPTPTPIGVGPVTVTATVGTLGPTDYGTVKAAFDAINAGTHRGAINIFILGNTTETAPAVLNASGSGASVYTSIIMRPTGVRTVSGAIAAGSPLIDLNGADVVTIDGLNTGGNSLTFSNTTVSATAGTSTIRFINGAQNNTVKNCNIQGSSTVTVGATAGGTVLFSTSPAAGSTIVGNNNNTISTNNIGPAGANLPVKAITGLGTTTSNNTINTGNVIDGNNILDFFGSSVVNPPFGVSTTGIDLRTGNHNWTIQNNRIYQTATRTFSTTALRYAGITLSGTTGANGNAHTIRNNIIGFGSANGTGTTTIAGSSNEVRGLDLPAASSGTATSVQGNIISGINQTSSRASTTAGSSPFIGISLGVTSGVFDVGNVSGNTIGSLDGSSTIVINSTSTTPGNAPVIAIYDFSLSSCNVSNNNIGAITINSGGTGTTVGFRGILVNTSSASTETINNNTIGGTNAAGAITDTQVGSYVMYGIQTALPAVSMTGNTIRNMVGNSNFPATVVMSGINANISTAATNTSLISRNTIHSLSNASGAAQTSIYALDLTLPATTNITANVIERNLIHSLSNTSTNNASQIWGIVQRGSGTAGVPVTATVKNNMIRLGINAAGNSITSGLSIMGIFDIQGTGGAGTTVVSYYFNSVYIGGSGVLSSSNTFAFNSTAVTSTRSYRDNIFWNARSNASGGGKNYAITVGGTAPNPAGLTSNYNDLFATGTGGFVGLFNAVDRLTLANWQTATGQDANSISVDPLFVNPTGTAATVDLHIQPNSPAVNVGLSILGVTNDFDNDARGPLPDIGADEIPVCGNNVAAASNGSTATASSQLSALYPASGVINGEHNGNDWGMGGGWADNTAGVFPDNVEVNFNTTQTINEIDVYTIKDDINSGSTVTDATTFGVYGATAYDVQYWTGSVWQTVTGGSITGNNFVKRRILFAAVTTDRIRVVVNAAADNAASRIVEVEAFTCAPQVAPTPTPTPTPSPTPTPCDIPANNVALASNGSTTSASSQYSAAFPASGVNNGEHNGNDWSAGGGWADSNPGVFPDNVEVNFNVVQTISEIDVFTLKDDFNSGSTVNDTTTFTSYGITNFNVQYWTGAAWTDVPGGAVTGNNFVKRKFVFAPIATDKIRVVVNSSADGYSRVVEIEAFSCTPLVAPTPTPTPTPNPCAIPANNVALASNGSTTSASTEYSVSFPASGVNNGEHNGNDWAAGGGWADSTLSVFPDNVEINFNIVQTINEIDVYTLKDDFNSGSSVNDATTFTNYGITSFQVQYWNGAAFVDVPGGNVTGNNLVKRKFIFPNIATDRIRVVVNGSADGFSRVVEIEAFSCTPLTPPAPSKGSSRGVREAPLLGRQLPPSRAEEALPAQVPPLEKKRSRP